MALNIKMIHNKDMNVLSKLSKKKEKQKDYSVMLHFFKP